MSKRKEAFTLIEVIFVIVILGIIASIGSSMIVNVYENYIVQKALHNATVKTDLAVKQIASRLTYRVSTSLIGKKLDGTFLPIEQVTSGSDYRILEWIGYDNDSFTARQTPGWSGFCDIDASSKSILSTPGSKLLSISKPIIENLGGDVTDAAIIFNASQYKAQAPTQLYAAATMGFGIQGASTISPIGSFVDETHIRVTDIAAKTLWDQYKLVWSAYAIVPSPHPGAASLFDLELYYNYQPWLGEKYSDGSHHTLAENVTVFKYNGIGDTIRFKLCIQEKIGDTNTVNICKEKAVIR